MLEAPPEGVDRRTAAEKRYDETQAKREAEMSKKMALKSHRERVNEFNTYLQNLSEHHDIPRWGLPRACSGTPASSLSDGSLALSPSLRCAGEGSTVRQHGRTKQQTCFFIAAQGWSWLTHSAAGLCNSICYCERRVAMELHANW